MIKGFGFVTGVSSFTKPTKKFTFFTTIIITETLNVTIVTSTKTTKTTETETVTELRWKTMTMSSKLLTTVKTSQKSRERCKITWSTTETS